ncbi:MAG: type II 3-dehydroquinate dehydratase [Thermotogaceae bacterium]|nr:type II 3-dehydroquinate dehydratase [Thermotogaceae bacterium]
MMILVINGPNMNMLGKRDKKHYGDMTYQELVSKIKSWGDEKGVDIEIFQSNHEGEIVDRIQKMDYEGLIINPGAFTHYSYSIRDALEIVRVPKVEVHISNIYAREEFRKRSVIAPVCDGQISGLGFLSYILALEYVLYKLQIK